MVTTERKGGVFATVLKVVNRLALLALAALLCWVAFRVFGGDASSPLSARVLAEFWALFAAVPLFIIAVFTFIVRGLVTGTLQPSSGDMDVGSTATHGDGSTFGSIGD